MKVKIAEYFDNGDISAFTTNDPYFRSYKNGSRWYLENEEGWTIVVPQGGYVDIRAVAEPKQEVIEQWVVQYRGKGNVGRWLQYAAYETDGEARAKFNSIEEATSVYNWRLVFSHTVLTVL